MSEWETIGNARRRSDDGWETIRAPGAQQAAEQPGAEGPGALSTLVSNIPGSAANFARGVAQPFIHPVETVSGLQRLVSGAAQKIPGVSEGLDIAREKMPGSLAARLGTREDIAVADAVGQFYTDRYGSLKALRNTALKDPVGLAADVSAVSGLLAQAARVGGLARTADVVGKVSDITNPVRAVTRPLGAVTRAAAKFALGKSTGAGGEAIEQALGGSRGFREGMRGDVTPEDIVQGARDSLQEIKNARAAAYQEKLGGLKNATQELSLDDLKALADEWLKRYNVTKAGDELDFSRATVSGASAAEVKSVYEMIQDWGARPGDATPFMLDTLKRRLDDFYSTSNNSRAMVQSLKKATATKISKAVPSYGQMQEDYARMSGLINEMDSALSLRTRASADTALRKLMTALREDSGHRRNLIEQLDIAGNRDVMGLTAGNMLSRFDSTRLGPLLASVGGFGLGLLGNWRVAALLAIASPRIVGELTLLAGQINRGIAKPLVRSAPFAYQSGSVLPPTEDAPR